MIGCRGGRRMTVCLLIEDPKEDLFFSCVMDYVRETCLNAIRYSEFKINS